MSEGFPKTATKTPEQQLIELREIQRALVEAREAQDAPSAEALMEQYRDVVEPMESSVVSSEGLDFEEVERLFGKDFLGPKTIEDIFGIKPETVPDIPFSKVELERAKDLGQQLVLYTDVMAGKAGSSGPVTLENMRTIFTKSHDGEKVFYSHGSDDFWYKDEDFFKKEKPRTGWRLTSKDLISDSTSKNYLEQTDRLVEHLKNDVFKGVKLPKEYENAVAEFTKQRADIEKLMGSDSQKASQALVDLKITKLLRETPVEVMYRLIANDQVNKDKSLPSTYTWTASRASDGDLVDVGRFDAGGTSVNGREPRDSSGYLGVSFSRS